jgi:hypothetical protein
MTPAILTVLAKGVKPTSGKRPSPRDKLRAAAAKELLKHFQDGNADKLGQALEDFVKATKD